MNPFEGDTFSTEDILAQLRVPRPPPRIVDPSMEAVRESGLASHGLPQLAPLPAKQPAEARSNTLGGSRYPPAINPGPELDYAIGRGAGLNPFEAGPALWEGGKQAVADWGAGNKEKAVSEFWGPTVLGIFAGPKAKTANLKMLKAAQEMHGKASPEEITQKTGWSRTTDGQWQFEINDNPSRLTQAAKDYYKKQNPMVVAGFKNYLPMVNVFEHSALYKAYPEAANIRTSLAYDPTTRGTASFHPPNNQITVIGGTAGLPDVRKSFLHELNHWVAKEEGFEPGASMSMAYDNKPFIEEFARNQARLSGVNFDQLTPEAREKYLQRSALEAYLITIGETASRNVERRADMTAKKRKEWPPERTEDVLRENQIPAARIRPDGESQGASKLGDENPFEPEIRPMSSRSLHDIGDAQYTTPYRVDPVASVPIGSLHGSHFNPDKVPGLIEAIRANRWLEPLVVDRENNVVEGQHRLRALQGLGVENVPVHRLREIMTPERQSAIVEIARGQGHHREQGRQMAQQLAEIVDQEGVAALSEYMPPRGYEKAWDAAVKLLMSDESPFEPTP